MTVLVFDHQNNSVRYQRHISYPHFLCIGGRKTHRWITCSTKVIQLWHCKFWIRTKIPRLGMWDTFEVVLFFTETTPGHSTRIFQKCLICRKETTQWFKLLYLALLFDVKFKKNFYLRNGNTTSKSQWIINIEKSPILLP